MVGADFCLLDYPSIPQQCKSLRGNTPPHHILNTIRATIGGRPTRGWKPAPTRPATLVIVAVGIDWRSVPGCQPCESDTECVADRVELIDG